MLNTGNLLGKHRLSLDVRRQDLYETPPEAVKALLKHVSLPKKLWEPACGKNLNIVNVLKDAGHDVVATDLIDYEWNLNWSPFANWNFLEQNLEGVQAIVTNPPFRLANEFVRHAREICPLTIMLLRLAFIESMSRSDILDQGDLREILVFRNRLPMMHLDGWKGNKVSSAMAFAWFIWDRSYNGSTIIKRITCQKIL